MRMKRVTGKMLFLFVLSLVLTVGVWIPTEVRSSASEVHEVAGVQPEEALKSLQEGNKEYVAEHFEQKNRAGKRRHEVANEQHPFAVILGCADSRVPPEVVFNKGIGELFVVRSAGHVVDDYALGSLEYAVEHLGVRLILVLGHKSCGAVGAAVKGGTDETHVGRIIEAIRPAVEQAKKSSVGAESDLPQRAMVSNVNLVVDALRRSKPVLAKAVEEGKLKIAGGYYDLESGTVTILPGK